MYVRMYVNSVNVGLLSFSLSLSLSLSLSPPLPSPLSLSPLPSPPLSLSLSHPQRPEDRNSSLLLVSPTNVSNYLFTVVMFCTNQHGLSTEMSTSNSLNGSECVILEPPLPSPTSSLPTISPTTSSTSSGAPLSATIEPCKLLQ